MATRLGLDGWGRRIGFGQNTPEGDTAWPTLDDGVTLLLEAGTAAGPGSAPVLAAFGPGTAARDVGKTASVGTTGNFVDQDINGLMSGSAWDTRAITYSFPTSTTTYGAHYSDAAALKGFQALSAEQEEVVRYAFGLIAQYTGLVFTQITETTSLHGTIRIAGSANPETSYAYYPGFKDNSGDVFLGNIRNVTPVRGDYAFDTILHEIGHAMGLKHGFEDSPVFGTTPAERQSTSWSIMEYSAYVGGPQFFSPAPGSGNRTYMSGDISALQYLYGANFDTNATDTVYTWNVLTGETFINGVGQGASTTNTAYGSIWDGGGSDSYDLSNYSTNLVINLNPGEWSLFSAAQLPELDRTAPGLHHPPGNISNANLYNNDTRSLIENAIAGNGNDFLTGNSADNWFSGGLGNDTIDGAAGSADTALYAGSAGDYMIIDEGQGRFTIVGPDGSDRLIGVERLRFGASDSVPIEASPDDYSDTIDTTGTLVLGGSLVAAIGMPGDHDWFRTTLTAGITYWINVEGVSSKQGTLPDPALRLLGSDGVTFKGLRFDTGIGADVFLSYTPTVTDTYFIDITDFSDGAGTYRLSEVLADDYAANPGAAGDLVGSRAKSLGGVIDAAGDRDWFEVELTGGRTYWFRADGASSGRGTLTDPFLRLMGDDGRVVVATDHDSGIGRDAFISFTPSADAFYHLEVGGAGDQTGSYRVGWSVADDLPASPATSAKLTAGQSRAGKIEAALDVDWIQTSLTAGQTYWFEMKPIAGTDDVSVVDPILQLRGNDGMVVVARDDDSGTGTRAFIRYTATETGTYFLAALGYGGTTGSYSVSMALADDAPEGAGTNRTLNPGANVGAAISFASDSDWFRTNLSAGETYWFSVEGASSGKGTLTSSWLRIIGADGEKDLLASTIGGVGEDTFIAFTPTKSGPYHVAVAGMDGGAGTYRVSAKVADDYAAVPATGGTLGTGTGGSGPKTVFGAIDAAGDSDWFRTSLSAGHTYWFSMEGSPTGKGSLADPSLRLLNADGTSVVAFNRDGGVGTNAFMAYRPTETGIFYVAAAGIGGSGTYVLTRTEADDAAPNPTTSRVLSPGGITSARIDDPGDSDWFRISLTAEQSYWFGMQGSASGKGTLADPVLRLLGADGMVKLVSDDDAGAGKDSFFGFTPTASGIYYLTAEGYGGAVGTYQIRTMLEDDYAANPATIGRMTTSAAVAGSIDGRGDADWFGTRLTAGQTYVFDLEGAPTGKGSLANPYLQIYGNDGTVLLGSNADGGDGVNARLSYTPTETGLYHIAALGSAGTVGTYLLRMGLSHAAGPSAMAFIAGGVPSGSGAVVGASFAALDVGAVTGPGDLLPSIGLGEGVDGLPPSAMVAAGLVAAEPLIGVWGNGPADRWSL